jgi:hypothetical protein
MYHCAVDKRLPHNHGTPSLQRCGRISLLVPRLCNVRFEEDFEDFGTWTDLKADEVKSGEPISDTTLRMCVGCWPVLHRPGCILQASAVGRWYNRFIMPPALMPH